MKVQKQCVRVHIIYYEKSTLKIPLNTKTSLCCQMSESVLDFALNTVKVLSQKRTDPHMRGILLPFEEEIEA
jgi:hypothetical protein